MRRNYGGSCRSLLIERDKVGFKREGEKMGIFELSIWQWVCLIFAACFIGLSKTGVGAFALPAVPIIATVFGGKESTGIMLPMLLIADVFAIYYYKRHADWDNIKKLLPWVFVGLVLGIVAGNYINDKQFKIFIAIAVFLCLFILIYTERKGDELNIPNRVWFYALTGVICGFTSMIGNAAGPIFSVYLLAMGFKKDGFMGTTTWFFFINNLLKLPLQILFWHNITSNTVLLGIILVPAITVGALLGVLLIRKINEEIFRKLILAMTAVAAVRLLM
jgi:uncharacterized protein